jgi:hypothetical protein
MEAPRTRQQTLDYIVAQNMAAYQTTVTWKDGKKDVAPPPTGWNKFTDASHLGDGKGNVYALLTGAVNGIVMIDWDEDKAEADTTETDAVIDKRLAFLQRVVDTCTSVEKTPGGYHYYFKLPNDQTFIKSVNGTDKNGVFPYIDI